MARPRLLPLVLALTVALLAPLATPASGERAMALQQRALDSQLLLQVNALRAEHGLQPLRLSRELSAAASRHSFDMAVRGYFSHSSSNGTAFWQRIRRFYPATGFRRWRVGENLVWESPALPAPDAIRLWLASPAHRANLLSSAWRDIGIGAVRSAPGRGVYKGLTVTIVTADFGARRR